jgi:hypothetical protein
MSPSSGSVTRHPPSLHRVASGRLPRLHRYYRDAPTPCRPSRRTSFPSLGGTTFALNFAPTTSSASPRARSVCSSGAPVRNSQVETTGPPGFLEDPHARMPRSPTPARPPRQAIAASRYCLPPIRDGDGSRIWYFGAQSRSLRARCLRFAARVTPQPRKTRFRPVANLRRAGMVTCWVSQKGFKL